MECVLSIDRGGLWWTQKWQANGRDAKRNIEPTNMRYIDLLSQNYLLWHHQGISSIPIKEAWMGDSVEKY